VCDALLVVLAIVEMPQMGPIEDDAEVENKIMFAKLRGYA